MTITTSTTWTSDQPPPFPVRRFTLDEYHRMIQAAVLSEDDPVELLDGWIVPKMPHSPRHDATIDQIQEVFSRLLPSPWRVRVQSAVTIGDSEPEPDLAIVRGPAARFAQAHPEPVDIALLIEVSDTSLAQDRSAKGQLYAQAGIPVYWIANLVDRQIEVYSDPQTSAGRSAAYRSRRDFRDTDSVPIEIAGQATARVDARELWT